MPALLLPELPEECLAEVLTRLPVSAVARCAASCRALNDVASLDSTWRTLCLSTPALQAFAPHAAHLELDAAAFRGGWRQLGKKLKGAPKLPGPLELPDAEQDTRGSVQMRTTPQGQCIVSYTGSIGSDRAVRTREPWLVSFRKSPKPPPTSGYKMFRYHLKAGGVGQPGTSCNKEIAAFLARKAERARAAAQALEEIAEAKAATAEAKATVARWAAAQALPEIAEAKAVVAKWAAAQALPAVAKAAAAGHSEAHDTTRTVSMPSHAALSAAAAAEGVGADKMRAVAKGTEDPVAAGIAAGVERRKRQGADCGAEEVAGVSGASAASGADDGQWASGRPERRQRRKGGEEEDPRNRPQELWNRMDDAERQFYFELAAVRRLEYEEATQACTRASWSDGRLLQPVLSRRPNERPQPWLYPDALPPRATQDLEVSRAASASNQVRCDAQARSRVAGGAGAAAPGTRKTKTLAACFGGFRNALTARKDLASAPGGDGGGAAANSMGAGEGAGSLQVGGARSKLVVDMLPVRYFEISVLKDVEEMDALCAAPLPSLPGAGEETAGDGSRRLPATRHAAAAEPSPAEAGAAQGGGGVPAGGGPEAHVSGWAQDWCLSVGICLGNFALCGFQPGWDYSSAAVHSDDGRMYFDNQHRPQVC